MSLFQCSFFSKILCTTTKVLVSLPSYGSAKSLELPVEQVHNRREKKVLYLLHGMFEDETIWLRRSNVERYATEYEVALVMPYGENSYYTDMAHGLPYFTYLTEELPRFIQNSFGIMQNPNNTAIAGLSMGGYGACKAAFLRPDLFGAFASISGAVDMQQLADMAEQVGMASLVKNIVGHPEKIPSSDTDIFYLAQQCMERNVDVPKGYISCGLEDEACYPMNQKLKEHLEKIGYPFQYHESHGAHEWNFWDAEIQKIVKWLREV
ncbi:MAG: prolyl oligopeptidase family serine peptidase [Epulopiscium sp.]|jgi:putative tributyrin esterase|nr:prolyl oligopeptidase family serine peptidase [Candidatus Epulonipiscium sp.]